MFWKLVLGSLLLTLNVDAGRYPCKKAAKKMDKCLKSGYELGECAVGSGQMTTKQEKRCKKLAGNILKKCPDYECEPGAKKGECSSQCHSKKVYAHNPLKSYLPIHFQLIDLLKILS